MGPRQSAPSNVKDRETEREKVEKKAKQASPLFGSTSVKRRRTRSLVILQNDGKLTEFSRIWNRFQTTIHDQAQILSEGLGQTQKQDQRFLKVEDQTQGLTPERPRRSLEDEEQARRRPEGQEQITMTFRTQGT